MKCCYVTDPSLHSGWQKAERFVILNGEKNLQPTSHKKSSSRVKRECTAAMLQILCSNQPACGVHGWQRWCLSFWTEWRICKRQSTKKVATLPNVDALLLCCGSFVALSLPTGRQGWQNAEPFVILNKVKNPQPTKHKKGVALPNVDALLLCCGSFVALSLPTGRQGCKKELVLIRNPEH